MTTSTNLTDRLGELIGCAESGYSSDRRVLTYFVLTHKDEILSALRKAEQPVSGDYAELVERLQAFNNWGANPAVCAEAATAIERLTAREAELRKTLKWYADPKNWWTRNSSSPGWHQTNLEGSMERHAAQIGTVVDDSFTPDCGDRARLSLGDEK